MSLHIDRLYAVWFIIEPSCLLMCMSISWLLYAGPIETADFDLSEHEAAITSSGDKDEYYEKLRTHFKVSAHISFLQALHAATHYVVQHYYCQLLFYKKHCISSL